MGISAWRSHTEDSANIGHTEMSEIGVNGKKDKNLYQLDLNESNSENVPQQKQEIVEEFKAPVVHEINPLGALLNNARMQVSSSAVGVIKKLNLKNLPRPSVRDQPTKRFLEFLKNSVNLVTKERLSNTEPMAMLGFGIMSYMKLLKFMAKVFFLLSILQLPVIYIYSSGTAYDSENEDHANSHQPSRGSSLLELVFEPVLEFIDMKWYQLMLGNLGYSSVNCDSAPVSVGYVGLECNYGVVGQIYDLGLHEGKDEDTFEMCVNTDYMLPCKPNNPNFMNSLKEAKGKSKHYVAFSLNSLYANPKSQPDRC